MSTVKLTLSADSRIIRQARQLANESHTSISALFSRLILALARRRKGKSREEVLGPLTRKALRLNRRPDRRDDRELLEEALAEKYGYKL